jgi:hypothetical protein
MTRAATLAALILTLAGLAAARAEDGPPPIDPAKAAAFDNRMFATIAPLGDKTTYACFVRRYDADHLANHPRQKVGAMKLLVSGARPPDDGTSGYAFRLGVKFRQRAGDFDSSGYCKHALATEAGGEVGLGCGVECDGGGIGVALSADDKSAIVHVERVRIWKHRSGNPEDGDDLEAGADDKSFRLERADLTQCAPLANDRKELAALRRQKASGG